MRRFYEKDPMSKRDEKEKSLFDSYSARYDSVVNEALGSVVPSVDYFSRVKAEYLLSVAADKLGSIQKLNVLDIGCGVGNFESLLGDKFYKLVGIDISPESIAIAQRRNPGIDFCVFGGKDFPFPDCSFDLVFTVCVMHHVPVEGWDAFLDEAFRTLRPGGLLVIFEHNRLNPLTRRIVDRCPFDADAVLVGQGELKVRLLRVGYENIKVRHILTVPAGSKLGRGVDRIFSRLPFGAQFYAAATKPGT
jgi:SAM-dependent methyltransferase